jgi:hypothetical protein
MKGGEVMSDINKQIDDILKECVEVCADCITCFDTDEYIEISKINDG